MTEEISPYPWELKLNYIATLADNYCTLFRLIILLIRQKEREVSKNQPILLLIWILRDVLCVPLLRLLFCYKVLWCVGPKKEHRCNRNSLQKLHKCSHVRFSEMPCASLYFDCCSVIRSCNMLVTKKEPSYNRKGLQKLHKCSHVKSWKIDLALFLSDRQIYSFQLWQKSRYWSFFQDQHVDPIYN